MRRPLLAALGLIALATGCYETPKPSCAFLCGSAGDACPGGYFCATDGWCKVEGVADSFVCDGIVVDAMAADASPNVDAAVIDAPDLDAPDLDAAIDAPDVDAPIDAGTDAAVDAAAGMLTIITASPLSFGTVVQTQSALRAVTVRNSGGTMTSAITIGVTGSATYALVTGATDTCSGQQLAPATNCGFEVRYTPTGVGTATAVASATATMGGAASINLTGDSVAALGAPTTVGLGSVTIGSTATMGVVFTNLGAVATGAIATTPPTGAFAITSDGCATMALAPAAPCTVTVEFAPTVAGAQSSMLRLDATPGGPRTVMLTGTGL